MFIITANKTYEVGAENHNPVDHTRDDDERGEPVEDLVTVAGENEVCKQAEKRGSQDCKVGNTPTVAATEDGGSFARASHAVQHSRGRVELRVTS